ncbi:hypothetical protein [Culicoidibacter larvae]|uniref:Uncharacterized protein n=1 Tax=Culicoidibacter larvae TaxID=2579976 RepID=A0A5R8Q998_9FIRM|nr:hypothetical protein [Culicoidibacter larvae]TLG71178.1 hypothetical protein FEZ08_11530 [Culicoidibacter larvae]
MSFKAIARAHILERMNSEFKHPDALPFTTMSEQFLNNYVAANKEHIYHLFGDAFSFIQEVHTSTSKFDADTIKDYFRHQLGNNCPDVLIENAIHFTRYVMCDSSKSDMNTNKIVNDFEISGMTFKVNQKVSKSFVKYVTQLSRDESLQSEELNTYKRIFGDIYDRYIQTLRQLEYIDVKMYMRISIDPLDYFYMGKTRTQRSCTNFDVHEFMGSDYAKAVFTYLQSPTFIATLHTELASAQQGHEGDYRRVYYYDVDEQLLLGTRPYGASKKQNIFLSNQVEHFFRNAWQTNFPVSSMIGRIPQKTKAPQSFKGMPRLAVHMSAYDVGYLDVLHYYYNNDYMIHHAGTGIQTSFLDSQEEDDYISIQEAKWNKHNPYKIAINKARCLVAESMQQEFSHIFNVNQNLYDYSIHPNMRELATEQERAAFKKANQKEEAFEM